MKKNRVTRYIADCGRGFWKRGDCERHEAVCTCWKNPKHRTCLTCKYEKKVNNSNGMEHEPQFLHTWIERSCTNPNFKEEIHFTPVHINAPDVCINCVLWENRNLND